MQKKRVITVKRGRKTIVRRSAPAPTHVADLSIIGKYGTHLAEQERIRFQPVGVRTTPISEWKRARMEVKQ